MNADKIDRGSASRKLRQAQVGRVDPRLAFARVLFLMLSASIAIANRTISLKFVNRLL